MSKLLLLIANAEVLGITNILVPFSSYF